MSGEYVTSTVGELGAKENYRLEYGYTIYQGIAALSDTHLGSKDKEEGIGTDAFNRLTSEIDQDPNISTVLLGGDVLDRHAGKECMTILLNAVKLFRASGKRVVYIWGNNEDRLSYKNDLRDKLKEAGVDVVIGQGVVEVTLKNGSKAALVIDSRVISAGQQKEVMLQPDQKDQIRRNRTFVNENVGKFEEMLRAAIARYGKVIVVHHAPEELSFYDKRYSQHANDPDLMGLARYKEVIDEIMGEIPYAILAGFYGHTEHGYAVNEAYGLPWFNMCFNILSRIVERRAA